MYWEYCSRFHWGSLKKTFTKKVTALRKILENFWFLSVSWTFRIFLNITLLYMRIWLQFKEQAVARSFMRKTLYKVFWHRKFWPSEKSIFFVDRFPNLFAFFSKTDLSNLMFWIQWRQRAVRKFPLFSSFSQKFVHKKLPSSEGVSAIFSFLLFQDFLNIYLRFDVEFKERFLWM